jgi:cyclohexadienyl dehydratase
MRRLVALALVVLAACGAPARAPIHAGTSGTYPPLSAWDGARPEGLAPAILAAFAESQRTSVAWTRFTWPVLATEMHAGAFDLAADGITVRPDRSIAGRFTVPIARGGAVLLTRSAVMGATPREIVDGLRRPGLRVVVNAGGYLEGVARRLLAGAEIRAIPDNAAVREAFARGDADAAMTNTFEAPRWSAGLADVQAVGPLTSDVTAFWLRADRSDLAEALDAWLLDAEASGRLEELRAKWLGAAGGGPVARPVDALLAATAERLALMPLVAAAKKAAGEGVEQTAQEERVLASAEAAVARAAAARGAPAPGHEKVVAFFRAEIEAAKHVQERAAVPAGAAPSLDRELRPAIARITARMAFLLVRVPPGVSRDDVTTRARLDLADLPIGADDVERIAGAIAAFGARP